MPVFLIPELVTATAVQLLAERALQEIRGREGTEEEEAFIDDIHQAAGETAEEFDGITEELLVLVLKSDEVQDSVDSFLSGDIGEDSGEELRNVLESTLTQILDSAIEVDTKEVTDAFLRNLQKEVAEDPKTWEEIMSRYEDEVSENMPEFQKEIHKSLFEEIENLQEQRTELQKKADRRFKISVVLGAISVVLAAISVYLSFVAFA